MKAAAVVLAACTLLLAGCNPPGLANRATAEDFTAAVAAEAALLSLETASPPRPAPTTPRPIGVSKSGTTSAGPAVCLPGAKGCVACSSAAATRTLPAARPTAQAVESHRMTGPQRWGRRGWFRRR